MDLGRATGFSLSTVCYPFEVKLSLSNDLLLLLLYLLLLLLSLWQ